MPRLLLDTNMPRGMRSLLSGHDIATARQMGWETLTNGDLLAAAEAAGFDAMVTADRNIPYQQNLTGRKIALIELSTTHWETIRDNFDQVRVAISAAMPGSYTAIRLPRQLLVRRPWPLGD